MNTTIGKIGRYLFGLPFGIFGLLHFMNASAMAGMVPIPGGAFWVYLTGLGLLAAAVAIVIEKKVKLAALLLGIMLLIFVLSIHLPGVINAADQMAMQTSMTNLLKDLAMAGAAFFVSGIYEKEDVASAEE